MTNTTATIDYTTTRIYKRDDIGMISHPELIEQAERCLGTTVDYVEVTRDGAPYLTMIVTSAPCSLWSGFVIATQDGGEAEWTKAASVEMAIEQFENNDCEWLPS